MSYGSYDISRSYLENYERGPFFRDEIGEVPEVGRKVFLGYEVGSRLGVAAGLLLNSRWVTGYAAWGFDLLTYKTVRSGHRDCYPVPNWVYVEEGEGGDYVEVDVPTGALADVSSAVCFGMPSMAPEVWREDVRAAKAALGDGQVLIVSVVATPESGWTTGDVADDFATCAVWAVEAGADVVEVNFGCPNVCSAEGSLYLDLAASGEVARAVRTAVGGDVKLLVKTGHHREAVVQAAYLRELDGVVDGVTLVNGLVRRVLRRDGTAVFAGGFEKAGVIGRAIHGVCVEDVRRAVAVIRSEGLELEV
ncbi:MAG: hypothetical protein P8J87_17135, partial [Verrucomicrobiales bacterium]|nr:hypothetical protein [Verrucomicrobiales bacterium]